VGVGANVRVGECEMGRQCAEAANAQGSCAQVPAFCWPPRPAKYGSYRRLDGSYRRLDGSYRRLGLGR